MITLEAPTVRPESVAITTHALIRYGERRNTRNAERGVRRLLEKARGQTTPLYVSERYGPTRRLWISGYMLIFNADFSVLITLWRT